MLSFLTDECSMFVNRSNLLMHAAKYRAFGVEHVGVLTTICCLTVIDYVAKWLSLALRRRAVPTFVLELFLTVIMSCRYSLTESCDHLLHSFLAFSHLSPCQRDVGAAKKFSKIELGGAQWLIEHRICLQCRQIGSLKGIDAYTKVPV